jgi:hypothetical protein
MSVGSVGSNAALAMSAVTTIGKTPDPATRQAQVNAQADLLQAVRSVDLPMKMVAARVSDNQGVDLYM